MVVSAKFITRFLFLSEKQLEDFSAEYQALRRYLSTCSKPNGAEPKGELIAREFVATFHCHMRKRLN